MSFSFDSDMFFENIFIRLREAPKGRYNFVLFTKRTLDFSSIRIVEDTKRVYSSDCIHYLIKGIEDKVIGSFFDVNSKKLVFDESKCTIIDSECEEPFVSVIDSMGGVYVFTDNEESFLLIPETPNINKYVVLQ